MTGFFDGVKKVRHPDGARKARLEGRTIGNPLARRPMNNGIAGIDHIIVGVRDLEAARTRWARLGFALTPRGRHIGQGTANYCIMFGRDYLELLGFVERDEYGHRLEAFLAQREGPMSVAFAPARDAADTRAALAGIGLHPSEPRALGRALELPEGTVTPRFSLLNLPPAETPALDCFICGHLTPELVRRPEWLVHPNGVTGIKAVHLLVREIAGLAPAYQKLFGPDRVAAAGGRLTVDTGRNTLSFTTPDAFRNAYPAIGSAADIPLPGIAALELAVESRTRTATHLRQADVSFDEPRDGRLVVPPAEATGTILLFAE
jgi:catechol 2,3-dioxygenase-like lactoylglutathione lyase family enzyme